MILFTSFTSSLSAAAETSSAPIAHRLVVLVEAREQVADDSGLPAPSAPKNWSSVSVNSRSVVTCRRCASAGRRSRPCASCARARGPCTSPPRRSLASSSGIQWLASDVVALDVPQQVRRLDAVGLERLVRYAEELGERLHRSTRSFTWNSSIRTVLDVLPLAPRGLGRELELPGGRSRCRSRGTRISTGSSRGSAGARRKAMASVLASSTTPSSCSAENGWPESVVDELDDADQVPAAVAAQDRRDQHLACVR